MSSMRLLIVLQVWAACALLASIPSAFGQGTELGRTLENKGGSSHLIMRQSGLDSILPKNLNRSGRISVSLRADKSILHPGDELELTAETNQDCFLTIMYIRPGGNVIVLWPNRESGGDGRIRARAPVTVPGPGTSFKIKVDGNQPQERIVAFATSEKGRIFKPNDFREVPGGYVTTFVGNVHTLSQIFRRRVDQAGRSLRWGTAHLTLPVSSSGERWNYAQREEPQFTPSFALRSIDGRYLSLKNGKASFSADAIGPTETFRLQFMPNNRFKIVGSQGYVVSAATQHATGPEAGQLFDLLWFPDRPVHLLFFGIGFRSADGKYMAADETPGQGITFTECAPSPFTRKGFFTLIPLIDSGGRADKGLSDLSRFRPYPGYSGAH